MLDPIKIQLQVDSKSFETQLAGLEKTARDTGVKINQDTKIKLEFDIAQFQMRLAEVKAQLKTATGTEKIQLQVDANSLQRGLTETKRQLNNLVNTGETTTSRLGQLFGNLKSPIDMIGIALGNVFANLAMNVMSGISNFFMSSVKQAEEVERAMAQLNAVITSTGNAAGLTAQQVKEMADALGILNGIEPDTILSTQDMLLTFTNIKAGVFKDATQATLDMATAMNSGLTPSTEDLRTTAIRLGKALNDPIQGIGALHKVGVAFSDVQKEQIKNFVKAGDVAKAQAVILAELSKEFGGSAQAQLNTYSGKVQQLNVRWIEFKETVGGVLIPILSTIVDYANKAFDALAKIPQARGQLTSMLGSSPIAKTLGTVLGPNASFLGPIGTVFNMFSSAKKQSATPVATGPKISAEQQAKLKAGLTDYSIAGVKSGGGGTSKAQQELKDIQTQTEKNTKTTKDYEEKVASLQKKFDDLKENAIKDLSDISNQMKEVNVKTSDDLAKRYVEINALIAKGGLETTEYNALMEEKAYIEKQDTKDVLDKAVAYDKLSESQKIVTDNAKELAVLQEKQDIAKAFLKGKVTASLTDTGLTGTYIDEKGDTKTIVDYKNAQYALDLENKQKALDDEKVALVADVNYKIGIEEELATKKLDINKKYHDKVMALMAEEQAMINSIVGKITGVGIAGTATSSTINNKNTTVNATITDSTSLNSLVNKLNK